MELYKKGFDVEKILLKSKYIAKVKTPSYTI